MSECKTDAFSAIIALTAMALSGCLQFADPGPTGSLLIYNRSVVPKRYRGLWADRLENCGSVTDRGIQLHIFERMVGEAPVMRIEGDSDHQTIVVSTDHPDPGQDRLFLNLSTDEQWLKFSFGHGTTVLRRCPDGPRH